LHVSARMWLAYCSTGIVLWHMGQQRSFDCDWGCVCDVVPLLHGCFCVVVFVVAAAAVAPGRADGDCEAGNESESDVVDSDPESDCAACSSRSGLGAGLAGDAVGAFACRGAGDRSSCSGGSSRAGASGRSSCACCVTTAIAAVTAAVVAAAATVASTVACCEDAGCCGCGGRCGNGAMATTGCCTVIFGLLCPWVGACCATTTFGCCTCTVGFGRNGVCCCACAAATASKTCAACRTRAPAGGLGAVRRIDDSGVCCGPARAVLQAGVCGSYATTSTGVYGASPPQRRRLSQRVSAEMVTTFVGPGVAHTGCPRSRALPTDTSHARLVSTNASNDRL